MEQYCIDIEIDLDGQWTDVEYPKTYSYSNLQARLVPQQIQLVSGCK